MKKLLLALLLLVLSCETSTKKNTPPADDTTFLKIGAFNIEIFGNTKVSRPNVLTVLAQIATNFDVMAIEEVGSNASTSSDETCTTIMNTYVARINELNGSNVYSYVRGNQYAIVYRNDKVKVNSSAVYSGTQTFAYTPLIANIETIDDGDNFDFSMVVIHTSPSLAETEIPALKTVMDEIKTLYSENDVICVGDYNADGAYYDEGAEYWLLGFDPATYITGIPNSDDTTVAASDNTYDRIQMTASLNTDYTGDSGVFYFGDVYDVSNCEGGTTTSGTEGAVSDHYPVWCEFYTDKDFD